MNFFIQPNPQKERSVETAFKICNILLDLKADVFIPYGQWEYFRDIKGVNPQVLSECVNNMDFVISVGGDGTILRSAHTVAGTDAKLLGVNTGTLGFMASLETDSLHLLEKLFSGDYTVSERMMLRTVFSDDGREIAYNALNDIAVQRLYSKIMDFEIYESGKLIGSYRADGVIFSTPTGSTGYSLSAGGAVISPELDCIEMTLICPHSIFARPMIFPACKQLEFVNRSKGRPEIYFTADGKEPVTLPDMSSIKIRRSQYTVKLVDISGNTFFNSLSRKLMGSVKRNTNPQL